MNTFRMIINSIKTGAFNGNSPRHIRCTPPMCIVLRLLSEDSIIKFIVKIEMRAFKFIFAKYNSSILQMRALI